MARLIGLYFLPGLGTLGIALLLVGIADPRHQLLAIAGSILVGSVLIATYK